MRLMHVAYGVAGVVVAGMIAVALLAYYQRALIYFPDATHYRPADGALTGVSEVTLDTRDGAKVVAWYLPAAPGKLTFLYFHGNGGGLLNRVERFKQFQRAGIGLFMASYRGYSGSTGNPSERAMVADARLAYDYLRGQAVAADRIALYGESLGTGVAVQLATEREIVALVLDAPYTSLVDMARLQYPPLLVDTLMVDRFESIKAIGKVRAPILIMHGANDTTIPVSMGKAMFDAAPDPKALEIIPGAGHSNIFAFDAFTRLQTFLSTHVAPKAG